MGQFDEVPQMNIEEVRVYMDELEELKSLCFEKFSYALLWVKEHTKEFSFDEDDGYIDFQLERLDCTFACDDDGYWKLTDITTLTNEYGTPILEVLT